MSIRISTWIRQGACVALLGLFALASSVQAQDIEAVPTLDEARLAEPSVLQSQEGVQAPAVLSLPLIRTELRLGQLSPSNRFVLRGLDNAQVLEFTLRRDRLVHQAQLNLVFTPSPALLTKLSHIRVYLNEELMGVVPLDADRPGERQRAAMSLNPEMITTFNRIRLEFIGHYTDVCEDLANSALWLDISRETNLILEQQQLDTVSDLAFLPEPFLDNNDMLAQAIPFLFAQAPDAKTQQAAGIVASYFGSLAQWRSVQFPVAYGALPKGNVVVLADNQHRPDFLMDYPAVDAPTIDIMASPTDPYQKILLVLGRDGDDLLTAAQALASGSPLLRGRSVQVGDFTLLSHRVPYDAPRWTPTDRPVPFSDLVDFPGQLQSQGLNPDPIILNLNLPPDLFVWRNAGIPMRLAYRYTPPKVSDESRLSLSLNQQFIRSFPLLSAADEGDLLTRLPVLGNEAMGDNEKLLVPALRIGSNNQIRFDFSFASTMGSAQKGFCQTMLPVDVHANIDPNSSIDFSGFVHYLAMPNLQAFVGSGFPFSRMADLSETVLVMPKTPSVQQLQIALESIGRIAAQVGMPAYRLRVMDDWDQAAKLDADILWLGETPETLRQQADANLILEGAKASLRQARRPLPQGLTTAAALETGGLGQTDAVDQVAVESRAPLAAMVELQSETHPQRSWVGLLASTPDDFSLLQEALSDSGKRDVMAGGVVVIRDSGVSSSQVGPAYFVGHLVWWQLLWYRLSDHPVVLVLVAVATVILISLLLWLALRGVARRRLEKDA